MIRKRPMQPDQLLLWGIYYTHLLVLWLLAIFLVLAFFWAILRMSCLVMRAARNLRLAYRECRQSHQSPGKRTAASAAALLVLLLPTSGCATLKQNISPSLTCPEVRVECPGPEVATNRSCDEALNNAVAACRAIADGVRAGGGQGTPAEMRAFYEGALKQLSDIAAAAIAALSAARSRPDTPAVNLTCGDNNCGAAFAQPPPTAAQQVLDATALPTPTKCVPACESEETFFHHLAFKYAEFLPTVGFWIALWAIAGLVYCLYRYPDETRRFLTRINLIKIGTFELSLQLDQILKITADWGPWDSGGPIFLMLKYYPWDWLARRVFDSVYFTPDWHRLKPWLDEAETTLVVMHQSLKGVTREDSSAEILRLKSQLADFYTCLGVLYGFGRSPGATVDKTGVAEERPVDPDRALHYLDKALELSKTPEALFCRAAVPGILGLHILSKVQNAVVRERGKAWIRKGLSYLAEPAGPLLVSKLHFKAFMLFQLEQVEEAAATWKAAAEIAATDPLMYFNYACCLADLRKYPEALTALQLAIELDEESVPPGSRIRGYVRDEDYGAQFAVFRSPGTDPAADAARSKEGKSFSELMPMS